MKGLLASVMLILVFTIFGCTGNIGPGKEQNVGLQTVSGLITQTASYCGGAAPSEEMLKELGTPHPLPNKTFYLKEGNASIPSKEIVGNFTSGQQGEFQFSVHSGTYCIIEKIKKDNFNNDKYLEEKFGLDPAGSAYGFSKNCFNLDNQCLEKWWQGCDYVIKVENQSIKNMAINFNLSCPWGSPCARWSCALPP